MDIRLIDATTGNVLDEFDGQPNGPITRQVSINPGVGTIQVKVQVRCQAAYSSGGVAYGASLVATQNKR